MGFNYLLRITNECELPGVNICLPKIVRLLEECELLLYLRYASLDAFCCLVKLRQLFIMNE